MTSETPEPGNGDVDDLGLTFDDWEAIRIGYNFGTMEPAEGTVEEEAFRRLDAENRRETEWIYATREKDDAYQRCFGQPFPGGPLTAGLTSREAAELSGKLYSAHTAAQRAERDADWRTGEHRPFMEMDREIWDLYSDTKAETIVSKIRTPSETQAGFAQRVALEDPWTPDPRVFERHDPEPDTEPDLPF